MGSRGLSPRCELKQHRPGDNCLLGRQTLFCIAATKPGSHLFDAQGDKKPMFLQRSQVSRSKRRGAIVLFVAVCLTVLLGVVAIALDGGVLLTERRPAQATADAAALAAASDLYKNFGTNGGRDCSRTAKASPLSTAAANGYANDGTVSVVTVNIPPSSGDYSGKAG